MTPHHSDTASAFLAEWFPDDPQGRSLATVVLAVKLDEAEKRGYERALNDERVKIALSARRGIAEKLTKGEIVHSWDLEALTALEHKPMEPPSDHAFVAGMLCLATCVVVLAVGMSLGRPSPVPSAPTAERSTVPR